MPFGPIVDGQYLRRSGASIVGDTPQAEAGPHATSHQNGGADEISVAGLSGVLADAQTPAAHSHTESDITGLVTDLAGKEPANANIQAHVASAHAPANAQANADITKAEIEAKLTGQISSHSHAGGADADFSLYKASDQTITTAGWVAISSLSFAVSASKAYSIEAYIVFQSSATTMGVRIGFTGPASPGLVSINSRKEITAVATAGTDKFSEAVISAYDTANPASTAEIAQGANLVHQLYGVFVNGANAGTFALRLDKENVAGTGTIKAGSWLKYRLLN